MIEAATTIPTISSAITESLPILGENDPAIKAGRERIKQIDRDSIAAAETTIPAISSAINDVLSELGETDHGAQAGRERIKQIYRDPIAAA